jgi:hypothetical protein
MGVDIYLNSIWEPFWSAFEGSPTAQRIRNEVQSTADVHRILKAMELFNDACCASGGYFRNGYNAGDVMWAMGLSWSEDVGSKLDPEGHLPIDRAREVVATIEARPLTRERVAQHFLENMTDGVERHPVNGPILKLLQAEVIRQPPPSLLPPEFESLSTFLQKQREQLLAILCKSIELDEPLEISL